MKSLLTAGCLASVLSLAPMASAALLSGAVNTTPPSPANLTNIGALDWAIWAATDTAAGSSRPVVNQKSGGAGVFSAITPSGGTQVRGGITSSQGFTWTDGVSPATGTNDATLGLIFNNTLDTLNNGVQFTVDGSTATERQVQIWGSGTNGTGTLTASLTGASNVVLVSQAYSTKTPTLFTINFRPDNASDKLTIRYVLTNDSGTNAHVGIQAAAIANVPEPAMGAAGLMLAGGLLMRRRGRTA